MREFRPNVAIDDLQGALEGLPRVLRLTEELGKAAFWQTMTENAAEQAAAIITGEWSDPED